MPVLGTAFLAGGGRTGSGTISTGACIRTVSSIGCGGSYRQSRSKRGVPRETRKRLLEQALPTTPEQSHLTEWRSLIDAVGELEG